MLQDFLQLIYIDPAKFLRENLRRIEEWAKRVIERLDVIDGGGP